MTTKQAPRRAVRPLLFLIMAGPVLLFVLNQKIHAGIGVPVLPVDASILSDEAPYLEAAGRHRFIAGVMFFQVIVLVSLVFFAAELRGRLTLGTRVLALLAFTLVQVPIWLSVIDHQTAAETAWRSYHQLGSGVMEAVLAFGGVPSCEAGGRVLGFWECGAVPGVQQFRVMLDLMNVTSGFGVAALVLGMILSLAQPVGQPSVADRAFRIARAQLASRRFLYMAGLLLSSGMFVTITWMLWPVPMVDGAHRDAFREVVNGALLYYGVFYTLLIVAGFGPVIFVQARRIDSLAYEALSGGGKLPTVPQLDKWKTEQGLSVSMVESLQALLAAGAPLITGFAGSFAPI